MRVYRITSKRYARDLSGYGAQLHGGRYNPIGVPALYTAEHISLAALEILVHVNSSFRSIEYVLLVLEIPDQSIQEYTVSQMPKDWTRPSAVNQPIDIGVQWLEKAESLSLKVPSVIVPREYNYVLNPRHPLYTKVRIAEEIDFHFDRRLIKTI